MKTRLLAVLLVSTLVLATAAPLALAQVVVSGNNNNSTQYVDCSQVQNAVQVQYGDQNAAANDNSAAEIANKFNITQNQVNACLGEIGGNSPPKEEEKPPPAEEDPPPAEEEDPPVAEEEGAVPTDTAAAVIDDTIPEVDELPETGGPSLLTIGAGLALVAGAASLIRSRR